MNYKLQKVEKKYFVGLSVRTSNATFQKEALPMWDRFYREKIVEKIANRKNDSIFGVYTEYEGDYTQAFTYMVACEVANLDSIPAGMVGIEVPVANYAVYTAEGAFPQSMATTWQAIWNTTVKRSYTTDFEVYPADFKAQPNPVIPIYICLK